MRRLHVLALAAPLCLGSLHPSLAQTLTGRVPDVPDDIRQIVIEKLQKTFIYPMLTIWKFDFMQPYPTEGVSVCGRVNFANSTRHYIGEQNFYAHLRGGKVFEAGIVARRAQEDPVLGNATAYKVACGGT